MFFVISKVLLMLILPPAGLLILMAAGFAIVKSHRLTGRLLIASGFLLLYLLSISPVSDALIKPLETSYPPLKGKVINADAIVVLGGGVMDLSWLGLEPMPGGTSLERLIYGITLSRRLHLPVVISGGSGNPQNPAVSEAEALRRTASDIGISTRDMVLEGKSRNTLENARAVRNIVKGKRIILVTSASHMRRASAMFRAQGFDVVAAPTNYVSEQLRITQFSWIPRLHSLGVSSSALYEYLSLAWYGIKGDL